MESFKNQQANADIHYAISIYFKHQQNSPSKYYVSIPGVTN